MLFDYSELRGAPGTGVRGDPRFGYYSQFRLRFRQRGTPAWQVSISFQRTFLFRQQQLANLSILLHTASEEEG